MIIDSPIISGSYAATGSLNQVGNVTITGSLTVTGPIVGALTGSVDSASFASTASFVRNAVSSSFATTASFATFAALANQAASPFVSATTNNIDYGVTFALSATPAYTTLYRAAGLTFNPTSSLTRATNLIATGSLLGTSSFANNTTSASYAVNTSFLNGLGSEQFVPTGSFNTFSSSILTYTESVNSQLSALQITSGSNITRISALETASGSAILRLSSLESKTGSYATTGSNTFVGGQYFSSSFNPTGFTTTASLYTDGGLRVTRDAYISGTLYLNNITVFGTQSVAYISSSQLNIGTNIISVNTDTPSVRFGGLAVYDSGSTGLTGSMLWDSQDNQWIYSNPSGSAYDSAMFLVGPRNTGALGSEAGITCNFLSKGNGMHHMTSSGIFEDGSRTCFYGTTVIGSGGTVCTTMTNTSCIGIGTTTPAYKLDVVDAGTNTIRVQNTLNTSDAYLAAQNTLGSTFFGINATGGYIYNATALPILFYTSGSERMRIDSGGNVGVGISNPDYRLDVNGTGRFTACSSVQENIIVKSANTGFSKINIDAVTCASAQLAFLENGTQKGVVGYRPSTGNVFLANSTGDILTIASTGAAVFSNALQVAGQQAASNYGGTGLNFDFTSGNVGRIASVKTTSGGSSLELHTYNTSGADVTALTISNTGAATFSSNLTIQGNDFDLNNGTTLHRITNDNTNLLIRADYGNTSANSTIQFSVDGTERMRITSDGVVGIGTTSPVLNDGNLVVAGCVGTGQGMTCTVAQINIWETVSVNKAGLWFGAVNCANVGVIGSRTATGNIAFQTYCGAWGERMRITYNGNVGIGTASPQFAGGGGLQINTSGTDTRLHLTNTTTGVTGTDGFELALVGNDVYYDSKESAGTHIFYTAGSERMRILQNGNIGIGTTDTQTFRLAVDGPNVGQGDTSTTIRLFDTTSATTGTGGGISFAGYFSGTSSIINTLSYIKGGKENSTAGDYAAYLSFGTRANGGSPTERMRITSGGNVLIGTAVSSSGIAVTDLLTIGKSGSSSNALKFTDGSSSNWGFIYASASKIVNASSSDIAFETGASFTERMRITSAGIACFACVVNAKGYETVSGQDGRFGIIQNGSDSTNYRFFQFSTSGCTYVINTQMGACGEYDIWQYSGATGWERNFRMTSNAVASFRGNILPMTNGTQDLGSSSLRWCTVYTSDLSLNNGIGNYTIVEGENDLFLYNNNSCKVYKFVVQEVCPEIAPAKRSI